MSTRITWRKGLDAGTWRTTVNGRDLDINFTARGTYMVSLDRKWKDEKHTLGAAKKAALALVPKSNPAHVSDDKVIRAFLTKSAATSKQLSSTGSKLSLHWPNALIAEWVNDRIRLGHPYGNVSQSYIKKVAKLAPAYLLTEDSWWALPAKTVKLLRNPRGAPYVVHPRSGRPEEYASLSAAKTAANATRFSRGPTLKWKVTRYRDGEPVEWYADDCDAWIEKVGAKSNPYRVEVHSRRPGSAVSAGYGETTSARQEADAILAREVARRQAQGRNIERAEVFEVDARGRRKSNPKKKTGYTSEEREWLKFYSTPTSVIFNRVPAHYDVLLALIKRGDIAPTGASSHGHPLYSAKKSNPAYAPSTLRKAAAKHRPKYAIRKDWWAYTSTAKRSRTGYGPYATRAEAEAVLTKLLAENPSWSGIVTKGSPLAW